jgi:hypothetical protein
LAINECYADLVFGTAALLIEEGDQDNPLLFTCVPIVDLGLEESSRGVIETIFRTSISLTLRDIKSLCPHAEIPSSMTQQGQTSEEGFDINDMIIYDEEAGTYDYIVTNAGWEILYEENKLPSQRFIVFRWNKLPGEVHGRGVAQDVIPDVKTLNEMVKLILEAGTISAFPPFIGFSDRAFNPDNIQLAPNTIISVQRAMGSGGLPIQPLQTNPNLQFADMIVRNAKESINEAFFTQPLGSINDPTKTATEISIRQQAFLEKIGTAFGRLEVEFLSRIIERCTYILRKKGLIGNIVVDGKQVALKYESPLATLQDNKDLENFQRSFQTTQGVFGEFTLAAMDLTKIPGWVAEKTGTDLSLYKSEEELKELSDDIEAKILQALGDQPQQQPQQVIPPLGTQQQQEPVGQVQ